MTNVEASVTEISEMVGFNTLRTFNRAFMKHMGCAPSEYRKRYAGLGHATKALREQGEKSADPALRHWYRVKNH